MVRLKCVSWTLAMPLPLVALGTWSTLLPLSDVVLAGNLAYV
jgi:hypothetical protein